MRAKALGALQTMLATQGQTVEEDHRAFRTLSIGQEDRTANRVKVRPFAGLNLLKTAECLAVVARWIRMAPQSFAGRAQRKMEGGAAEIRNGEERQEQGQPEPNHPPDNFSRLARQKFHQERIFNAKSVPAPDPRPQRCRVATAGRAGAGTSEFRFKAKPPKNRGNPVIFNEIDRANRCDLLAILGFSSRRRLSGGFSWRESMGKRSGSTPR